jgi:hypothetical protein
MLLTLFLVFLIHRPGHKGLKNFVEFNPERTGWHYGFAANKAGTPAFHCFSIYVFDVSQCERHPCGREAHGDTMVCIDKLSLGSFKASRL